MLRRPEHDHGDGWRETKRYEVCNFRRGLLLGFFLLHGYVLYLIIHRKNAEGKIGSAKEKKSALFRLRTCFTKKKKKGIRRGKFCRGTFLLTILCMWVRLKENLITTKTKQSERFRTEMGAGKEKVSVAPRGRWGGGGNRDTFGRIFYPGRRRRKRRAMDLWFFFSGTKFLKKGKEEAEQKKTIPTHYLLSQLIKVVEK